MNEAERPIAMSPEQRREDFKRRTLPLVVWSAAALIAVALLVLRTQRYEYVGLAQSRDYEISAAGNGTLETVVVALFEHVEAGDVVAKLDDAPLRASIETARATLRQRQAELEAARAGFRQIRGEGRADLASNLRRFQMDEEERRLETLSLKATLEGDRIELERLGLELRRAQGLRESGLISDADLDNARLLHDQVRKRTEDSKVLLTQLEEELRSAQSRRSSFEQDVPVQQRLDPVLQPIQEAIAVESRRLEEIELQRRSLVLRSPVSGQVSQVLCQKGQSLVPGEPILTITERSVHEIVAFLRDDSGTDVRENTKVLVSSRARPGRTAESVVVRVGQAVQPLPQRLWRDPHIPDYGRAVVIAAVPLLELLPGEAVQVRFLGGKPTVDRSQSTMQGRQIALDR